MFIKELSFLSYPGGLLREKKMDFNPPSSITEESAHYSQRRQGTSAINVALSLESQF